MTLVNVFLNTAANNIFMFFEQIRVFFTHFGSYLVPNMYQLAEARVVIPVFRHMPKCFGILDTVPSLHNLRRWKKLRSDVDDGGIRSAKLFASFKGLSVNEFCDFKAGASDKARPMTSSSHVVPAVLTWMPQSCFLRIFPMTG